ncbi:MAG TPA: Dabb family protein [Saprospiraceae bacterium]|nr:Dabb family protein [Saprospiraceae bacterium]
MIRNIPFLLIISLFFVHSCQQPQSKPDDAPAATPERELRHVVLFKFKDGLPADTIHAIERAFAGLQKQIPTIRHFEWGLNNSPEQLAQGYTHCFVVTFASEKDRDAYLPCAPHQAFVNTYAKPYVDKVCVVDFWASGE